MNDFAQPEGGDLASGVDHLSVLRKQVFCSRALPHGWHARPCTILSQDGWIVGTPRRKRLPSFGPAQLSSKVTEIQSRLQR